MTDTTPAPAPSSTPVNPESQEAQDRLKAVLEVIPVLAKVADILGRAEKVLAANLVEVVNEQPLGTVVDVISELKIAMELLRGDGSAVITNQLNSRITYVREVTMPNRFDREKVKTFNTDKFRVTRTVNIMASIFPEKKEEAFEWLRENGLGDLIKPTVNSSSLNSAAKEQIENGRELPEELFRTHTKDGTSITKLKPKRS